MQCGKRLTAHLLSCTMDVTTRTGQSTGMGANLPPGTAALCGADTEDTNVTKKKIGVLGAGTWGMALARMLCVSGNEVQVWSALPAEVDSLSAARVHPNLPGMKIPAELQFTKSIEEVCTGKDVLLFAVPSVFVRSTTAKARPYIPDGQILVDVAKGMEPDTLYTMTEVIADDGTSTNSMRFKAVATQSIMVLKTQIDQERSVADSLASKATSGEKDIYAILSPSGLRGYVFVEGMNTDRLREKTRDIKKARSFIDGETNIDEIGPYLIPMSAVVGIVEGDIVELVNGPFKGEKARVQQIDQAKEEITVELIEAMVPIPVTVKGDSVRVIEKER